MCYHADHILCLITFASRPYQRLKGSQLITALIYANELFPTWFIAYAYAREIHIYRVPLVASLQQV